MLHFMLHVHSTTTTQIRHVLSSGLVFSTVIHFFTKVKDRDKIKVHILM